MAEIETPKLVRTVDYNGNSLPAKPPVSEVNGYATPDWSPAKLNGFAAYAHSPYSAEDDAEEPDFNCSQRSSLQLDLQTVHSGAEMDHTKQQVKELEAKQGLFGLLRSNSKQGSSRQLSAQMADTALEASGGASPSKEKGNSSKWGFGKPVSKKLHTAASAGEELARAVKLAPERPGAPLPADAKPQPPPKSKIAGIFGVGRTRSHSSVPSFDLADVSAPLLAVSADTASVEYENPFEASRQSTSGDAAMVGKGTNGQEEIAPKLQQYQSTPSAALLPAAASRHHRSASAGSNQMLSLPATSQSADARPVSAGGSKTKSANFFVRAFSLSSVTQGCAQPSAVSDEGEVVATRAPPPPAVPNAGLYNFGNICYFNALLQCMLHTPHFVSILWQSFPEVEAPPPPPEHEPLSEWVPPLRPLAASSAASSDAPKPSPAKSTDGSTTPGRSVEGSEPSLSRASPPLSRASLKEVSRTSPSGSVVSTASSKSGTAAELEDPSLTSLSAAAVRAAATVPLHTTSEQPSQAASPVAESNADDPDAGSGQQQSSEPGPQLAASVTVSMIEQGPLPLHSPTANGRTDAASQPADGNTTAAAATPEQGTDADQPAAAAGEGRPQAVLGQDVKVKEMVERAQKHKASSGKGQVSQAVAYVMSQMVRNGKDAPVNPFPAVYSIAQHLDIIDGQQQDIHECWMGLKDILDEARHDNAGKGRLQDIFMGKMKKTLTCKQCQGKSSLAPEEFWDQSMSTEKRKIDECLAKHLTGTVEGWCDACKKAEENPDKKANLWTRKLKVTKPSRDAVSEFAELPPVLVLHLKRTKGDGTKDKTPISVQMHLSLWANLSEEAKTSDIAEAGCTYKLYALIFHRSGVSTSSGHYNAYCRVGQDDKKDWWKFDDNKVEGLPKDFVAKDSSLRLREIDKEEVCMLFYERLGARTSPLLAADAASARSDNA